MRHFLLLICGAATVYGQTVEYGVLGGGSLTDAFHSQTVPTGSATLPFDRFYSSSKDWILGASVEFHVTRHLSLEANGLYRKLHFVTAGVEPGGSLNSISPSPVVTWEFPVLAKYRFRWRGVQPFVEGGPSFRTAGNLNGTNPSHYGGTAGVGLDMHVGILNISPVLRYTRWAADSTRSAQPYSNPNQLELLVEVSHGSEIKGHPWGNHFLLGVIGGETLRADLPSTSGPTIVGVPTGGSGSSLQNATATYSGLHDPIIGPMVEFPVPKGIALEIDALYHPLRYHSQTTLNGTLTNSTTFNDAITWDFPVLVKYKFPIGPIKPFLEAGPSFRLPQNMNGLSTAGVATGVGVEGHVRGLKLAPTFRYVHWAADATRSTQNQLEVLLSISF
jgi:hypothetical protein